MNNTEQKKAAYELLTQLFSDKYAINSMVTAGQPPAIRVDVKGSSGHSFKSIKSALGEREPCGYENRTNPAKTEADKNNQFRATLLQ